VNISVVDDAVVNMELSVMSEEMTNSAAFEDEAVNDEMIEDCNADFVTHEEFILHLSVEDDSVYSSSSVISPANHVISPAPKNSVITESDMCLTECPRNMSSSLQERISSHRTVSQRPLSAAGAAQAKVFRQYLLDGDVRARILELDTGNSSRLRVCV